MLALKSLKEMFVHKSKVVLFSAAVATALVLGSGTALAQNSQSAMTIVDTVQMLKSQGYTDIESIEREWGHYDVEATNSKGQPVELKVDSKSGKIVHSELD